jgi:hypothetical protein
VRSASAFSGRFPLPEPVIQTEPDYVVAEAMVAGECCGITGNSRRRERAVCAAQIDIEVFKLCRPESPKTCLDARTNRPTSLGFAKRCRCSI